MHFAAIVLLLSAPFEDSQIRDVKPSGTNDRAVLKGPPPWCKGEFDGESGWSTGRLSRAVGSSGAYMWTQAAIQLCENPSDPTWQKQAQALIQLWMNSDNLSQSEAEEAIEKAIAKYKKDKANEGKEPTDEERFEFKDYAMAKPEPGVETVKPGPMAWCAGVKITDKWDANRVRRTIDSQYGIEGTIDGARQLCWRPNDSTWQQQGAYVLQKWMNWTRQSKADAEKSLAARVNADKFKSEKEALCKELDLGPEVTGADKVFGQAQNALFGCSGRDGQTLWQENNYVEGINFYIDPTTEPANELIRLVHLWMSTESPWIEELPSKDEYRNSSLLHFAINSHDFAALDKAEIDKMLGAAPYNEYARIVVNETYSRLKAYQKTYEDVIAKVTKKDKDYEEILKDAPKKGWAQWEKATAQWKAELQRSNEFEAKLSQPSRKVLKGCNAQLRPDVQKLVKSYKSTDFKDIVGKLSTDPIASLLLSRLAVCQAYEKVYGASGPISDIVRKGRDIRGPRSLAYYAVVDALAEALKDRPKMMWQLSRFYYKTSRLTDMYAQELDFSGGLPYNPEDTTAKGIVASTGKVPEGVEIKFKQTKYTYPEANCVDDKYHPLKIESDGRITYAQHCKYTGRMVSVDTTPRPLIVAPEYATGIKGGTYVVGAEYSERGKNGSFRGIVHFTKSGAAAKKIDTFYGFDL